ncbi:MAG: LCP family protein [Erysipelotrichales bacterium]|nr:LCP family protein [Erysipelotrichales bacterium]
MRLKRSIRVILILLFLVVSIIAAKSIYDLSVLPMKYFVRVCEGIFVINFVAAFCLFINKRGFVKGFSFILYLLLNIFCVAAIYYGSTTNKFLNNAFDNAESEYKTKFLLLSKNDYELNDLKEKDIAYYTDLQYKEKAFAELAKKDIKTFLEYPDINTTLEQDVSLIDNGMYIYLKEDQSEIKIDEYNIIYEFEVGIELSNEAIGEEELEEEEKIEYQQLTPGEYYNIFLGGYDFTNTFMDFNMLVSINKTNNEILITTIPRDFYITDAKVGKRDKLSDMGARGIETNMASVAKLFGVKIDYYIKVNTKSLVALVDAVGGITYCSDQEYTTSHAMILDTYNDSLGQKLHVKKGCQYLNGIQTLTVARERLAFKTGDNQRQKNCAKIMQAILSKMKTPGMAVKYPSVLEAVSGFYTTTIPKELITSSIQDLLENPNWNIKTQSVTGYGGQDYIFFGSTKDYVMYPHMNTVNAAKRKIQGMKYKKLSEL